MERKTYTNDDLGLSFSLPESLSVRQQMAFRARLIDTLDDDAYTRYWLAVLPLIDDWQCEAVPDPAALDLDSAASWDEGDIVQYVANTCAAHMMELRSVPKKQ